MSDDSLERAAEDWIADYFQARHLLRTRDWLLELDPGAGAAERVAALTHDIERRVPGGPQRDATQPWDDPRYLLAHSMRSARIVGDWLRTRRADSSVVAAVERLILHHEIGGFREADLLQAADSLSFLEVNADRPRVWVEEGRLTPAQAQAWLDWVRDRIQVPAARARAEDLHAAATAALGKPVERSGRTRF